MSNAQQSLQRTLDRNYEECLLKIKQGEDSGELKTLCGVLGTTYEKMLERDGYYVLPLGGSTYQVSDGNGGHQFGGVRPLSTLVQWGGEEPMPRRCKDQITSAARQQRDRAQLSQNEE